MHITAIHYVMILMVLKYIRPILTPNGAMNDLVEEETAGSLTETLKDASVMAAQLSQHGGYHGHRHGRYGDRGGRCEDCGGPSGPSGHSGSSGSGNSPKSKCIYCKLTPILQLHAKSGIVHRWEKTTMSAFVSSVGSQDTSQSIVSPTNI